MKKIELIEYIQKHADVSASDATKALNQITKEISAALAAGDSVSLVGFGNFSVRHATERNGVNPATGEKIVVAARNIPTFKAGTYLKELLNSKS